ncbi:hypothetical protein FSW04_01235 [Baekduia soli]|uniref:Uncharacterized protein n=1 Tax=Baekduia soli TaxID=496014 RepID=A0A5B8U036_9ACTN|nr:hypothetical protein [Baekduia soli]QEC46334.1 hypothetical protein FSW04_01235 [Baekduia soli]
MSDDLSHEALSDMVAALSAEVEDRVSLDPTQRRVVLTALVIAANNGHMTGATEMIAQAVQGGVDLEIDLDEGAQAPATLRDALDG